MMRFYVFQFVVLVNTVSTIVSGALLSRWKSVTSSSTFSNWYPGRIVDGSIRTDADYCNCCAATKNNYNPWYELDLGQSYTIRRIVVQGRWRTDIDQHFEGMRILLKSVHDGYDGEETSISDATHNVDFTLSTPKSSRYVSLVLYERTRVFTICELSVYGDCRAGEFGDQCQYKCYCEGEPCTENGLCPSGVCQAGYSGQYCHIPCTAGKFGPGCTEQCGACLNAFCDTRDGTCPGGCQAGFQESMCKQECENGTYGSGCTEECGFCFSNDVCDKISGTCPDKCVAGYRGGLCKQECNPGSYGQDCVETCGDCLYDSPCIHTNGTCPGGCKAGYEGHTCKTECSDGRYGEGCVNVCGNCKNGDACNKMTGVCETGCAPGYVEPECRNTCSEGSYGDGCLYICGNCKSGTVCNHVNGSCVVGCAAGYMSNLCQQKCDDGNHGEDCVEKCGQCANGDPCNKFNGTCQSCAADYGGHDCKLYLQTKQGSSVPVGAIGGAAGALAAIIVVVIIVVVVVWRRKNSKLPDKYDEEDFSRVNTAYTGDTKKEAVSVSDIRVMDKSTEEPNTTVEPEEDYYGFLVRKSDLKVCQLWDYVFRKKKHDNVMFYQEFNLLPTGLKMPHEVAMIAKNRGNNRYRALCAYDHSRVPLQAETESETEYINASYINGIGRIHKFIASQGPWKDMRVDFLRMVWQHKIKQIVMLTNLVEQGQEKCLIYWPEKEDEVKYGNITVKVESEDVTTDYTIRTLFIKQHEVPWRTVTQYHFQAWPDKDVPEATWPLVKFWRIVMSDNSDETIPIVVHCSAGIGRTGTFIALDNAYNQAKSEGTVRMPEVVKTLREQRVNMVQTKDQYVFLHEAVADALLIGSHFIWSRDFPEVYNFLTQIDPETMKHRLQEQYKLIVESVEERRRVENDPNNTADAVYSNIFIHNQAGESLVTIDEYRPKSKTFNHFKELDAIFLPSYDGSDAFIVTKPPTASTREKYLSLIVEQNVKTVIMIPGTTKGKKREDLIDMVEFGTKYGLELVEETKTDVYRQHEFRYIHNGESATVCQFELLTWNPKRPTPDDAGSMLDFLDIVLLWQQRLSTHHPVLVHGSNGFEQSGLICVLLNELERMKRDEGHINIVETVKLMKERDENIIPNYEQYKFVYDVILGRFPKEDDGLYETPQV